MDSAEFHSGEYLTFRLAGQEFAIDAARVKGIVPMHHMETVEPQEGDPQGLMGHAAVLGRPFPVLDLARWLGLRRRLQGRNPYIIVIDSTRVEKSGILGFPVDRVCDVMTARERDYSHGKLRVGRARRILDADRLFSEAVPAEATP